MCGWARTLTSACLSRHENVMEMMKRHSALVRDFAVRADVERQKSTATATLLYQLFVLDSQSKLPHGSRGDCI